MRTPRHGELCALTNKEAYAVWKSRGIEPELMPPVEMDEMSEDPIAGLEVVDHARVLMASLNERLRTIISLRFFCGMTLAEAGDALGVTRERVRQLEKLAIRRMRMEGARRPGGIPGKP